MKQTEGVSRVAPPLGTYAKVDQGILGLDLFRPLPRRGRDAARKRMFEVETVHGGRRLSVIGPYTLGADDLSILLAVLALSGLAGKKIQVGIAESQRVDIVDGLESEGDVVRLDHIRTTTTLYAICREAGVSPGGDAYERVKASLLRMRGVDDNDFGPVGYNSKRFWATGKQNFLTVRGEEEPGEFVVVINARFAAVMLGAPYSRVDLDEARSLGEMARLLHLRLSVMVRQGCKLEIGTDLLCEKIYGSAGKSGREKLDRRKHVREGMKDLNALPGWTVTEDRRRLKVHIQRVPAERLPVLQPNVTGDVPPDGR